MSIDQQAVAIADRVVPHYRNPPKGRTPYSCTSHTAKRWQAAYDGALIVLAQPGVAAGGEWVQLLALRAIKAVTATTKDATAALGRVMSITRQAGILEPYSELMANPDVALIVKAGRPAWQHLFAAPSPTPPTPEPYLQQRIGELIDEGDGAWTPCSGCQEDVDGYVSERDYPYSPVFRCQPGGGCSECGGIGVIWRDRAYFKMREDFDPDATPEPDALAKVGADEGWVLPDFFDMHTDVLRLRSYDLAGSRLSGLLQGIADMLRAADAEVRATAPAATGDRA